MQRTCFRSIFDLATSITSRRTMSTQTSRKVIKSVFAASIFVSLFRSLSDTNLFPDRLSKRKERAQWSEGVLAPQRFEISVGYRRTGAYPSPLTFDLIAPFLMLDHFMYVSPLLTSP